MGCHSVALGSLASPCRSVKSTMRMLTLLLSWLQVHDRCAGLGAPDGVSAGQRHRSAGCDTGHRAVGRSGG